MRIVIVGPAYPLRGGNALYVAHLYEALQSNNNVEVISYSRLYPGFLFPGVRQTDVSSVPMKPHPAERVIDSMNPFSWLKAAREAAAFNPDFLVVSWWNPFFGLVVWTINSRFKRATKKPVVIIAENVVSHEARWIDAILTSIALKTADAFLVLSKAVESRIRTLFPDRKVFRSSLPVYDCYLTAETVSGKDARHELNLDEKNVIMFFGYIRKYKGLMNLIEAMPEIKRGVPNLHLLIVGEFYDDPAEYKDAIERRGIADNVTIVNEYVPNEQVRRYFDASNLVVLPYNEATQSGILNIAYAFGKPVIVTDVGGLAELVQEGKTGYVVPAHDVNALARSVVRYFRENRELEFSNYIKRTHGGNDFKNVETVFEDIYKTLIEGRSGSSESTGPGGNS